jgi:hypothetical protein
VPDAALGGALDFDGVSRFIPTTSNGNLTLDPVKQWARRATLESPGKAMVELEEDGQGGLWFVSGDRSL